MIISFGLQIFLLWAAAQDWSCSSVSYKANICTFYCTSLELLANPSLAPQFYPPEHISDKQLNIACTDQMGVKLIFRAAASARRRKIETSRIYVS